MQAASPAPQRSATTVSSLAPPPGKYYVMAVVLTASFFVAGWRGLALILAISPAHRTVRRRSTPRRSSNGHGPLVISSPSSETRAAFRFPSTTLTFFAVTFGGLGVLALVRNKAPMRVPAMVVGFGMVLIGCLARIALGFHWPSDVFLTSLICMLWIWAASRVVLSRA